MFDIGQRVGFFDASGDYGTGRITKIQRHDYWIIGDDRRRFTTSHSWGRRIERDSIEPIRFGLFVFDTRFDSNHRSRRHSATYWKEFCNSGNWRVATERVHSLKDLCYFLRRPISEPVLMFNGHGREDKGWKLTNGDCFAPHEMEGGICPRGGRHTNCEPMLDLHPRNRGKIIVFSSCDIGKRRQLCEQIRRCLSAKAVIAYAAETTDQLSFVVESCLMYLLEQNHDPEEAVRLTCSMFRPLIPDIKPDARSFPLKCYVGG